MKIQLCTVLNLLWTIFMCSCVMALVAADAFGQTPDVRPLTAEQAVERELKGDEAHSYSLALTAGQYLNLVVEQKGVDVIVTLFNANNKKIAEVDSPNGTQGAEPLSAIAESAGNYRLEVRSPEKNAPVGKYTAKINELRTATEKDKNTIAAQKLFADAEALRVQGTAESLRGAIKKYEEALSLYRIIGSKTDEVTMLNYIGLIYSNLGERQKALEYFSQALPPSRAVGDKENEALTLSNIGAVYNRLGEPQKALYYYSQSLPLSRAVGDKETEAMTLNNVGLVYNYLGELQKALEYYSQSLPLLRAVGNKEREAATLCNIGGVYNALGERQKALEFCSQSLTLVRAVGDKAREATTLNNIGGIYNASGERQKALEYYAQSLTLLRAVGDKRGEARTLTNTGLVYDRLGERQKALEYYNQSLPLARAVGDKSGEARTLSNIGQVYNYLGERQKALEYYAQTLPLARAVGSKEEEAATLDNLAALALNNPRFAAFYGKLSVNNFQVLRSNVQGLDKNLQQTFLKSVEAIYRRLADALIAQGRLAEAQQVLNAFKDQQFFDFSQNKRFASLAVTVREAEMTVALNQKLETLVTAIRAVDTFKRGIGTRQPTADETGQLKSLADKQTTANEDYLAFLKQAEREFAQPLDDKDKFPDVPDLAELQTALRELSAQTGEKTVAVYTLVGTDNFRALLVTPDGITDASSPIKAKELDAKALQLWRLLKSPKHDPQPVANELYRIVFEPLAAKLPKDTKTILWSLDGNLRYVPMATLHDGKRYLIERYQSVVFTRADRERITRTVSRSLTGTGLGSSEAHTVEMPGIRFKAAALPSVKTELEKIFRENNTDGVVAGDVLLDAEFTKPAMLASLKKKRPLVHIASHFKFEPGDEARSFLLLGDGSVMTLDEMKREQNLFEGVELLALSACQTAAQQADANGREVDGFAELAQRLGAGAVMASLWEVADDSTAELMTRFYGGYRSAAGTNKAEALRRAQLALLKGEYKAKTGANNQERQLTQDEGDAANKSLANAKPYKRQRNAPFAHPFYWSPFVLIGNSR